MAEIVIANQSAVGLSAQLTEFVLIELLEQRALVPAGIRIEPQVPVKLVLGDVENPDLQIGVGLGIEDEIAQPSPGTFDRLEFRRVNDFIHLRAQFLIEPRNHLLDRIEYVGLDDGRIFQRFRDQRRNGVLDLGRGAFRSWLETLLEQSGKLIGLADLNLRCGLFLANFARHIKLFL